MRGESAHGRCSSEAVAGDETGRCPRVLRNDPSRRLCARSKAHHKVRVGEVAKAGRARRRGRAVTDARVRGAASSRCGNADAHA
ncbi:hypothetical protein GLE_0488 [Lysobacter enzymogenes]|uniref:Uncharacterized protein n=1 Tax=Lysobacter enzymogenes TaxID=69 RepID=A0A0S2DBE1_LYSEN|nr:hypothetical protein GLE_0488 [Lysobacter enzymogenes]